MSEANDDYTVRLRARQEIDYEFEFTLDPNDRAEFEQWSDGQPPTPSLIAEFIDAGPAIDLDGFLTPANVVSEFTGDIEAAQ
ncbi:hypothetical protein [Nocardioides sp. BYT-33-1]|uniref:hypothetical protein n=1 Tax=Nocardioides sp. BYT-33-1 TaxID=3416952 RepID=UPI003F53B9A1